MRLHVHKRLVGGKGSLVPGRRGPLTNIAIHSIPRLLKESAGALHRGIPITNHLIRRRSGVTIFRSVFGLQTFRRVLSILH